jgi:hypothetical protein
VDFEVILVKPYGEDTISFLQPVKVRVIKKHLVIHVTTLEKNLSHFFPGDQKAVDSKRINGEDVWLKKIPIYFESQGYKVKPCDLHKGVKKIWGDKVVDPKYVQSFDPKSTLTVNMHEDYTVREVYPEKYNEIIKGPLIKTLFKYKKEDKILADHFHVDPARGMIIFGIFSENLSQVENVINDIIKNN